MKQPHRQYSKSCHQGKSTWKLPLWLLGAAVILLALFDLAAQAAQGTNEIARTAQPSDPILDLLLQKGIVSEEEVQKARTEAERIRNESIATSFSGSKWNLSKGIKSIELFGDLRVRFEDRLAEDPKGGHIDLQRLRYSARIGLRGELFDDFYYGVRLETGSNPRSPWVTAGTSASSVPYQGPFGKSNAGINVGQIYIGWRYEDWLDVTFGKMPNPLYTTPMVWDPDLNPEGMAEHLKTTIGPADFFLNFGQFLYEDTNPSEASKGYFGVGNFYPSQNGNDSSPAFLLAWQGGVNFHFTTNISMKVAPVIYNYLHQGENTTQTATLVSPGYPGTFVGEGATNGVNGIPAAGWSGYPSGFYAGFNANQTALNNLLVLDIPFEVNFKLGKKIHARIFGDFAENLEGDQRAMAAYKGSHASPGAEPGGIRPISSPQTDDTKAYQFGLALSNNDPGLVYGSNAKKHTWEARAYWQHVEQYALDPNLMDSDFFEGRANMEGFYSALAYAFTDNVIGTVRFGIANRINKQLGTGGANQDIPQINPVNYYQIWQVDLTVRF
jgi:hypothetical protein